MADYGVYFSITNNTGAALGLSSTNLDDATYDGPTSIPSNNQSTLVHLDDPDFSEGASGTIVFSGSINGVVRQYSWYGSCPVGSSNDAEGPGITEWSGEGGHPTNINIYIDATTPGWTQGAQNNLTAGEAAPKVKPRNVPGVMVKFEKK